MRPGMMKSVGVVDLSGWQNRSTMCCMTMQGLMGRLLRIERQLIRLWESHQRQLRPKARLTARAGYKHSVGFKFQPNATADAAQSLEWSCRLGSFAQVRWFEAHALMAGWMRRMRNAEKSEHQISILRAASGTNIRKMADMQFVIEQSVWTKKSKTLMRFSKLDSWSDGNVKLMMRTKHQIMFTSLFWKFDNSSSTQLPCWTFHFFKFFSQVRQLISSSNFSCLLSCTQRLSAC